MGIGERYFVVAIETHVLIMHLRVVAGKLTVGYHSQLVSHTLGGGHSVCRINQRCLVERLIVDSLYLIGVISDDAEALEWIQFQSARDVQEVALGMGVSATLQIRYQRQLRVVTIGVDRRYGRTESSQRMVEALAQATVAKRSLAIGMAKFDVGFQLQPVVHLRAQVGTEVVAFIPHVSKTQDAILVEIASRHIILRLFSSTTKA